MFWRNRNEISWFASWHFVSQLLSAYKMNILLSVVIPTHNRARYAFHAIASLLAIPNAELEVVVSDTSTDGELFAQLTSPECHFFNDPRLKYVRPAEKLDMTGNHNAAIEASNGEYVCLIGDDDTISADALLAAAWAKKWNVEVIAPNVVANYVWPDFRSRLMGAGHASRLYVAKRFGGAVIRDSPAALSSALTNAAQGTDGLPKIYHGIVRRLVLERIRALSGAYFQGSSPDVSGAVGLALCSQSFVVVDFPLTIPGASSGSNTGRSAMNTHKGKLGQESQTKAFEAGGWSQGVPRFFSVETVWAHAALETIRRIAPHQVATFNFARLIAVCRVLHVEYALEIDRAIGEAEQIEGVRNTLRVQIGIETKRYRHERLARFVKRLSRPTAAGGRAYISGLETIAEAPAALAKRLEQLGLSWEQTADSLTIPPNQFSQ
jgi:Glycosyl transferase family 2